MGLNQAQKLLYRSELFRHLDGLVMVPTIATLLSGAALVPILDKNEFSLKDIVSSLKRSNDGYLNVALRLMASQGWLSFEINEKGHEVHCEWTAAGKEALQVFDVYRPFKPFISHLINIRADLFSEDNVTAALNDFRGLMKESLNFSQSKNGKQLSEETCNQIQKHLEGFLIGPVLVTLGREHFFEGITEDHPEYQLENFRGNHKYFDLILDYLQKLGWISREGDEIIFTPKGLFFARRAPAYGVTVSYLPLFLNLEQLLFGDPARILALNEDGSERHVNRAMNVWGGGGSHIKYFQKIDEIVLGIFDGPLEDQPVGIADMGCGDGTLLKHLYALIKNETRRGKNLESFPLKVVGADLFAAAREATRATLSAAKIDHSIVKANIAKPAEYAETVKDELGLDLVDFLNVRSFLDHNRVYTQPKGDFSHRIVESTGAYAFRGRWIPNIELRQNLVEHFESWVPFVGKHGLLILELHTIPPETAAKNLGKSITTAYDGTHGFSDQYIVELPILIAADKEAGLTADLHQQTTFPQGELAAISINLFKAHPI